MLDLQRMFQESRHTQDMPMGLAPGSFNGQGRGDFSGAADRFTDRTMRLGDLFQNIFGKLGGVFGNHGGQSSTPQMPGTPTQQGPQPMGNQYSNPFGASVTGGTLGAMLARQPTY